MIRTRLKPEHDLTNRRVLEIGCGRGDFARWLAGLETRPRLLVAADFAVSAVAAGKNAAGEQRLDRIAWQVSDIGALGFPDASFDTVFSLETIEHCPSPMRAVTELARVLKPGGRLYLTTPNYLNLSGLYRIYLPLRGRRFSEAGQPINHPMLLPRTRALVRRAGLRILAVESIGHPLPLPGGAIDMAFLERFSPLTRWFGIQSMVVAEKLPR
jgi:2-polyprenyl-3-methyl-5-hydroxy-6-metoxy-1,4-benzoquinol methylase